MINLPMRANRGKQASHWQQASHIAFLLLYGLAILFAIGWATSNIRQIPPESRAAVFRMGKLMGIHESGLLLALPKPFEQVVVLPSAELTIERHSKALQRSEQAKNADLYGLLNDALAGSGYLLTGDLGIVQLDVKVFYQVQDAKEFVLQGDKVLPAFDRLVTQSAMSVCAERDLDTILVARPEQVNSQIEVVASREQLRADLKRKINQNLLSLTQQGAGLGLNVVRVDVQSSMPTLTMSAFNAVLTASQQAAQEIAAAQNEATQRLQTAAASAEHIVQQATAQASERVAKARADTQIIYQLTTSASDKQKENSSSSIPPSLQSLYRERMEKILKQAKRVDMVTQQDAGRLIIEGASQ